MSSHRFPVRHCVAVHPFSFILNVLIYKDSLYDVFLSNIHWNVSNPSNCESGIYSALHLAIHNYIMGLLA